MVQHVRALINYKYVATQIFKDQELTMLYGWHLTSCVRIPANDQRKKQQ